MPWRSTHPSAPKVNNHPEPESLSRALGMRLTSLACCADDGRPKKKMTCFKCGGEGHKSSDCAGAKAPEAAASSGAAQSSGARKMTCFQCGREGHKSSDCPGAVAKAPEAASSAAQSSGARKMTCFQCGGEGHKSSDCPGAGAKALEPASSGARKAMTCFKCGREGHKSSDCPGAGAKAPEAASFGGARKGMNCFKCGQEGHKSADCPGAGAVGEKLACYTCGEVGATCILQLSHESCVVAPEALTAPIPAYSLGTGRRTVRMRAPTRRGRKRGYATSARSPGTRPWSVRRGRAARATGTPSMPCHATVPLRSSSLV